MFYGEKLFTVEQFVNKQNDRVWCRKRSSVDPDVFQATRRQGPTSIMVWARITASGRTPLVFVPEEMKISAEVYRKSILQDCLVPWATNHFSGGSWVFQQDSAPAHNARMTQEWLRTSVPDFISTSQWPPYSPDLNPLEFSIWSILESKVCATKHRSLDSLKHSLKREWERIPQEIMRKAVDAFMGRLDLVIRAKGGHIENY